MKKKIISIFLILPFIFLSNNINAQEKEKELFNETFPKLGNELKCSDNTAQLDNKTVKAFRVELVKLAGALDDLEAYKIDVLVDEAANVFTNKKLKKRDIKLLEEMIGNTRNKIIAYMGSLTKFGADSVFCTRKLALYDQFYNAKNFNEAYKHWNFLFTFVSKIRINYLIITQNLL